jgi:LmbE family N-acetylglucosaminyl deacetylase
MKKNSPVLVVAAHPDDEVLGAGGTIAKLAAAGRRVEILILGEGATSRFDQRTSADPALASALTEAARRAAARLGTAHVSFLGLPDNRFDSLPLLDVIKPIEALIAKVNPEIVFTHHGGDLNVDHVVAHRAVLTATRPVPGSGVRAVYAFEVPSATEWAFQQFTPAFTPNVFVDIETTLSAKLAAMAEYETESRPFPHPRSPEIITALARVRGSAMGVAAAEAFALIRQRGL